MSVDPHALSSLDLNSARGEAIALLRDDMTSLQHFTLADFSQGSDAFSVSSLLIPAMSELLNFVQKSLYPETHCALLYPSLRCRLFFKTTTPLVPLTAIGVL